MVMENAPFILWRALLVGNWASRYPIRATIRKKHFGGLVNREDKIKVKIKMVDTTCCGKTILLIAWALLFLCSDEVLAKSRVPISDVEIRQKKNDCYADIESGLWGQQCKSSTIAKENCALQCLSPVCYELIYESDPLEEGEKDFTRSSEYKYCMHRVSLGESLAGIRGSFD